MWAVPSGSSLGKGEHRRKVTDWSFACLAFMCAFELSCLAAADDDDGNDDGDNDDDGDDGDDDSFTVSNQPFQAFIVY